MVAYFATMRPMSVHPLRAFRDTAKMTLADVGKRLGVHKTTVLRWEEGKIPAERALAISEATGIPMVELRPDLYARTHTTQSDTSFPQAQD